jgi:serine phosphatase RsbU (regulator of sigma subunit)
LGAVTSSVWLVSADGAALDMRYETNAHPEAMARFASVPLDADLPGPDVIASGEPCFVSSLDERDRRWPLLSGTPTESEAMVVLPLEANGQRLGVVSFGFPVPRGFDDEDRLALLAVADQCAIGLDRARLYEREWARAEAQFLLATLSGVHPSMDWEALARHAVVVCATGEVDLCALYVSEGHLVRRVALASQTNPELEHELVDRYPTPLNASAPNAAVIRTGAPAAVEPLLPGAVATAALPSPGYAGVLDRVETGAGRVFPLKQRGVTFGSMLFMAKAGRELSDETVLLVEAASERTANMLSSASAFAEQRAALEALHEVVLPIETEAINGLEIAARYVPLASTASIGGDWWDALALPDGRVAVVVGDVAGHGIPYAAIMGQLRNALRMALVSGREPAEALGDLSRFLDWTQPDAHCIAVVAVTDAATDVVRWANAGHPPLLVKPAGGEPAFLAASPEPPVGVVGSGYSEHRDELPRGATLVLYTDGLIEGRTRDIDAGMRALAAAAETIGADEPLGEVADRLLAVLVDRPADDVCLLVVRRPRLAD